MKRFALVLLGCLFPQAAGAELAHIQCKINKTHTQEIHSGFYIANFSFDETKSNKIRFKDGNTVDAVFAGKTIRWGNSFENKIAYNHWSITVDRSTGVWKGSGVEGRKDIGTHEKWESTGTCEKASPGKF